MNDVYKAKMKTHKQKLVDDLKSTFPDVQLFEDEISKTADEEFQGKKYYALVLTMGDFNPETPGTLRQNVSIDYYSEERDDVDETVLDIITVGSKVPTHTLTPTSRIRLKVKDTDRFVDVVTINFVRTVKYDCKI